MGVTLHLTKNHHDFNNQLWYDENRMNRKIEPGLLRIFRLFAGLEVIVFITGILTFRWLYGTIPDASLIYFFINLIGGILLFGYLSWPWLMRTLKGIYLPIALGIITITPILGNRWMLDIQIQNNSANLVVNAWQLMPMLFVPLVLIAWQYSFRIVFWFSVMTSLVDFILILPYTKDVTIDTIPVLSVVVIRSVSFMVVGFIITNLMVTQRQQRRALAQANIKLNQYADTIEQLTVSRERNRLARELHDTLAHTLSALAVNLEATKTMIDADQIEVQEMIDQSLNTTRNGLTETRRVLKALRAAPLDDLGLEMALQQLVNHATGRSNLNIRLEVTGSVNNLSPNIEQNLFRIAQEGLENIIRHANAQNVILRLSHINGFLSLEIIDDGKGFQPAKVGHEDQLGIVGMQERASMLGGKLEIASDPDNGTTILFRMEEKHDQSAAM
jgi:signal transduction histidine kinase